MADDKALKESLEIMEFVVGQNIYGINIAKVREIVQYSDPTPSPDQNPCVEGILMLRGNPIPIINLAKRLGTSESTNTERNLFIITTFNNLVVGLHVHKINGIKKLSWSDIKSPDETVTRYGNQIITGIVNFKDYIMVLLDFEKIVADINPVTTIQVKDVNTTAKNDNKNKPIMIVDDSQMLNQLITKALNKAGYNNIIRKSNGQEAWDYISAIPDKAKARESIAVVISDIEMPVMDGLTLCKNIKNDNFLRLLPVIMFSSIIDASMNQRCEDAGADMALSKPEIGRLVNLLEEIL